MHARTHRQRNTHTYSGNYTHIHGQVKTRTNIHMYTHTRTLTATCAQLPIATVILNLCTFTDTQHINGHTYTCMHYTLTHAQTHTLLQAPNYSLQQLILNFVNRRNKQAGRGGGAAAGGGGRSLQQQVRCVRKLCARACVRLCEPQAGRGGGQQQVVVEGHRNNRCDVRVSCVYVFVCICEPQAGREWGAAAGGRTRLGLARAV